MWVWALFVHVPVISYSTCLLGRACTPLGLKIISWHFLLLSCADFGPYGWLERFDPSFTPNTTDLPGRRYAFRQQPEIGQFNVMQLARAMVGAELLTQEEAADCVVAYGRTMTQHYEAAVARKLGLRAYDRDLSTGLMQEMYEDAADYTNTFRALSSVEAAPASGDDSEMPPALAAALGPLSAERAAAWGGWLRSYRAALRAAGWGSEEERRGVQDTANPALVPRNHVLVKIISEAEGGNYEPLQRYMAAMQRPYESAGVEAGWTEPAPVESRMGVELLSCSS